MKYVITAVMMLAFALPAFAGHRCGGRGHGCRSHRGGHCCQQNQCGGCGESQCGGCCN